MSVWKKSAQELLELKEGVEKLSQEVADCFGKQERLAVAKQELDALEVEAKYFDQYCKDTKLVRPAKAPRKGLKSENILRILQECETRSESEKTSRRSLTGRLGVSHLWSIPAWLSEVRFLPFRLIPGEAWRRLASSAHPDFQELLERQC